MTLIYFFCLGGWLLSFLVKRGNSRAPGSSIVSFKWIWGWLKWDRLVALFGGLSLIWLREYCEMWLSCKFVHLFYPRVLFIHSFDIYRLCGTYYVLTPSFLNNSLSFIIHISLFWLQMFMAFELRLEYEILLLVMLICYFWHRCMLLANLFLRLSLMLQWNKKLSKQLASILLQWYSKANSVFGFRTEKIQIIFSISISKGGASSFRFSCGVSICCGDK